MKILKSLTAVSGYTMGSRIFGFFRDTITASLLGSGAIADALFVAIKLPSLLRRLLAEGAFNAAFIPMFAGMIAKEGKDPAKNFAEEVFSVLVIVLISLVVIVEFAMPWLIPIFVPGFNATPERLELAITFSRITFPFILFISLTALYSGILNSFEKFAAAAASPMMGNIFIIAFVMTLSSYTTNSGALIAGAITGCGVVQLLWVLIPALRSGAILRLLRPKNSPNLRKLLVRMGPAALGSGVHQLNVVIGTAIASILPVGSISYLHYAERLNQLPLSVIGTALSVVLLPFLAKSIRKGHRQEAKSTQTQGIELAMLLTVPAAVALFILAEPLIKMLYQHGAFDAQAARYTSYALMAYSLGLPAYVLAKIFNASFYALEDTVTPLITAVISVVVDVVLSLILLRYLQHVGIALATAISAWVNVALLGYLLSRKDFFSITGNLKKYSLGLGLSCITTGFMLWVTKSYLIDFVFQGGIARILAVLTLVMIGLSTFFTTARLSGVLNLRELKQQFREA